MSALAGKSLTEVRGIAQSFGLKDLFNKSKIELIEAIEAKQREMIPAPTFTHPYDARLMTRPPSKQTRVNEIMVLLQNHMDRGLKFYCDEEHWYMHFGVKDDHGSLRMPLKTVLRCADKIMEP